MRVRASREVWVGRIRSWKASGKTAEEFSARQPIQAQDSEVVGATAETSRCPSSAHRDDACGGEVDVDTWPGPTESTFNLHDGKAVSTVVMGPTSLGIHVSFSRSVKPVIARICRNLAPSATRDAVGALPALVDLASVGTATRGSYYDAPTKTLVVRLPASEQAIELDILD